ncbi:hypothetical protein [Sporosarcina sp. ACRSL]|uniref:hypothetical protein n=1 Tax=Sporosarcina sp. ACRSL TaxID=2918215 RepID=UPI001EF5F166|nr:hypothetical protein [Sporosarcina sp. ACRSL]
MKAETYQESIGHVIGHSLSMPSDAIRNEEDAALHDNVINLELSDTEKDTFIKLLIGQGAIRKELPYP